jgi:5'-3' exoribonuclease 1
MKFSKKNEEMLGYARYQTDCWEYSGQAVDVLAQYITKFPALFVYLQRNPRADHYKEEDLPR